ncbi:hypothetical protein P8C59_005398 [Phyllachora maydis]|uniref:Reverse transcriptase Ty1/copia-type domain-containing protein n=1 Tax=Phyllachora maydis TaxID=1825666 RepID=A0AAD9MEG7_9PEZI|nr:hypothetical protein P8C59_005398 [Phyllachora maydis]
MADQAQGKEDEEDGEDYSEVIEVLKQYIKSYERVIASQSSDIKALLLSLNTLKASVEDSVSAIKNISSILASLTNSSNAAAATTGKTSYSPRFDPFSGTMDLDSPLRPPRKEPYLGPAVDNTATSNLDPPIDTGSKEGFKDTITSSIVKELSKKAYTIPDDKNPDISNTYSDSDQAVLLMLLRDSLSNGPRAAISWIHIPSKAFKLLVRQYSRPIESKKEDVYNEFHALTFSTYKKGLSAFNAEFNGYLAKLTIAKIDIDPSLILNQYFKALESKFPSWVSRQKSSIRQARMLGLTASSLNIEYLMADILEESRNPATEAYRAAYIANSSNSTPNSNSNPSKKGKNKKKGKKASYNVKEQNYSAKSAEQASFMLGSYNLAIEEEEESDSSSNSSSSSDFNTQLAQLLALKGYKKRKNFKGKGLKTSSNKAKYKDNQPRRRPRDPALYNSQLRPINTGNGPISPAGIGSITLEVLSRKTPPTYTKLVLDNVLYLPNIDINIVSRVRHYDSGGCLIKETLYRGDRRCIALLDFKKSGFFLDVKGSSKPILHANFAFPLGLSSYTTKSIEPQRNKIAVEIPSNSIRKEDYRPIIEDAIVSEAIEPNKRYKLRNSPAKGTTLEGVGPSLRGKRPYRPCFILEAVVELVNSTAITNKETTPFQALFDELEPSIPHKPNLERYRAIGARGEAIIPLEKRSKSLKFTSRTEECKLLAVLGSKTYLVYLPSRRAVLKTSTVKFIEDNTVLSQPTDNTALKGELVDLDLDLEGAVSPDPSNLNTEKPISIEIGPSKLEPYKSSSDSELDEPLPDKPINPVIVESTRPTISIRKPELPEAFPQTIELILKPKPIEVIAPNQPITNEPLDNNDLISEGDKMQLDYYKLLAKTSSYILSFVYKARKRVISKDSTPTTYKQVLKLPRDERSKWLEAITKEFIQLLELGVFKFLPRSLLPSNRKLITCRNVLKVKKDAKNRPIKYESRLVARGFIQVEGLDYTITYASTSIPSTWRILLAIGAVLDWEIEQADFIGAFLNSALREEIYMEIPEGLLDLAAFNKAIYKLLLKYGYNPSTPNIIKLSKALYNNCLFIGPNIGYITDLKKGLNKVYAIEDLGPATYFLGVQIIRDRPNRRLWLNHFTVQWLSRSLNRPIKSHLNAAKNLFKYLNSTKDYSICFSYNGNTVADLGPKLSNSSNTTTKLSRDFYSKEGPRPLTTTSTTIVDSRNSKGSSRTSIINSSLVPIGFSDSDFAGDKATSKSTYGYLYKLAGRPISWKTKRATTIALSTLEAETDGLTEAICEVQWIIGLFSELYRPIDYPITLYGDNQGSITVANDPALHARTKHTLLKFRVSAIKNISSTLASLTKSSNAAAATTGKTSYSPRFDPFSGTIDLDSPLRPPRKEPYLGPAVNSATSNLDPPTDTGSKEGFKDTITSSIVKELFKKAYTIPDDTSSLNIEYLIANILEESRNPATEAYRAAYTANNSNSTSNSNSNPSKKGKNKKKGKKKASYNVEGQNYSAKSAKQASFMLRSYNLAIEEEEESDFSSNSRYKKRKDFKGKGLKTSSNNKAKYKDNQPRRRPRDPALYNSWLYNTGSTDHISNSKERFTTFTPNTGQLRPINTGNGPVSPAGIGSITLEVLSRKAPPTYTKLVLDNVLYLPNIDINIVSRVRHYDSGGCLIKETLYRGNRRCIAVLDFKKSGFFLDVKGRSKPILHAIFAFPLGLTSYNTTKSIEPQRNKIVVEIPSDSIRKKDYRPIIEDAILFKAIEPKKL